MQEQLRHQVVGKDRAGVVELVAGVDVAVDERKCRAFAAVAVLDLRTLELRDQAVSSAALTFPYIPGLLSFRELPPVLEAIARLCEPPGLPRCSFLLTLDRKSV